MTTWTDHYCNILAHPVDDGPRLVAADWLMGRGDPLGEFIVVQCELANIDGLTQHQYAALRREESRLLSAVSPETCPRCKGEKNLMYHGDGKSWRKGKCLDCKGDGTVPVSNAVRWAGKLGGRNAEGWDNNKWHVGWGTQQRFPVMGRFVRGFIGAISLSCAALVGTEERCGNCNGTGSASPTGQPLRGPGSRSRTNAASRRMHDRRQCWKCNGSGFGRVGGLRSELRQHPLGECVLSDKRPYETSVKPSGYFWNIDQISSTAQHLPAQHLPEEIYENLEGFTMKHSSGKGYDSATAASAALSAACCRWIREVESGIIPIGS